MLVTSNRSVAEWGGVFSDAVVATAILDRLLHPVTSSRSVVTAANEAPRWPS
jgi:DNA replication protein DnaC